MRRKPLVIVSGTVAAVLVASALSSSAAASVPGLPSTSLVAAEANTAGESSTNAWESDFSIAATDIEVAYPESFAYSGIKAGSTSGYVAFKSEIPQGAPGILGDIANVSLIPNAGFTSTEIQDYAASLASQATTAESSVAYSAGVTPRPLDRRFEVAIGAASLESADQQTTQPITPEQGAIVESAIDSYLESKPPVAGFAVTVEQDPLSGVTLEAEDGGRKLAGVCTGGFPVKRNAGPEVGFLTAGHCPGTGNYNNTVNMFYAPFYGSQSTTYSSSIGGDFRWNHSRYLPTGYTNLGEGGRKRFTQVANAQTGSRACHYGYKTGHGCSPVQAVGVATSVYIPEGGKRYDIGPLVCTLAHITDDGDSGGPWYLENTAVAVGIHQGEVSGSSCFSQLRLALNAFNVSLWVG